jgi:hypothetical protein
MAKSKRKKFDPRLKAAMQEIHDILERYNIAGHVVLVSPSHSEFATTFPKWSLAQYEKQGKQVGIRFSTKNRDFPTSKEECEAIETSVHMIEQFRINAVEHFRVMDEIMRRVRTNIEVVTTPIEMTPHDAEGERAGYDERHQAGPRRGGFAL